MSRLKFLKKHRMSILMVATFAVLTLTQPVLANTSAIIDMSTVSTSNVGSFVQTIANVIATIGAGIILIYGMLHTFGVASAGKNANKRQMAIESLGYVFFAVFIFFALNGLGGVIRGVAQGAFGNTVQ